MRSSRLGLVILVVALVAAATAAWLFPRAFPIVALEQSLTRDRLRSRAPIRSFALTRLPHPAQDRGSVPGKRLAPHLRRARRRRSRFAERARSRRRHRALYLVGSRVRSRRSPGSSRRISRPTAASSASSESSPKRTGGRRSAPIPASASLSTRWTPGSTIAWIAGSSSRRPTRR